MRIRKSLALCLGVILTMGFTICSCSSNRDANILEGDTHPYIGTKKITVSPTNTAPEIDGKRDSAYTAAGTKISLDEFNLEYWDNRPENDGAVVYVTYDTDYLYLYVEVADKNIDFANSDISKKDHVAVLLDFNYIREKVDYTNYFGDRIGYVTVACDNTYTYDHAYQEEKYYSQLTCASVMDEESDKYTIEMRLPFVEGFTGEDIGFEVMNIDCGKGTQLGVRTWNLDGSQMTQYAHCAGTLQFESGSFNLR